MAHFVPCPKLPTAAETAQLYLQHVFRLHGLANHLVSDRGPQFTSRFWQALHRALGTQVHLSSAFHPQTDGQTERTNGILEQYLRCYVCYQQDNWAELLPVAEFAYNNAVHTSTNQTPFMATYGYSPRYFPTASPATTVPAVGTLTQELHSIQDLLREQLDEAKRRYKQAADRKRQEGTPVVPGNRVWLSTRYFRRPGRSRKLDPRFVGPYPVLEQVNPVAFRLQLPSTMRIHPVFHRSLLVPETAPDPHRPETVDPPAPVLVDDEEEYEVQQVLDSRIHRGGLQYLVDWEGYGPEDRSWEPAENLHAPELVQEFHTTYPDLPGPSGEGPPEEGDSVRTLPLATPEPQGLREEEGAGVVPGLSESETPVMEEVDPATVPLPPSRARDRIRQQLTAKDKRSRVLEARRKIRSSSPEF